MSVRNAVEQVVTSPKIAGGVSALTTGSGVGTIFDLIPDDIGKLATLIGIILSLVLIYTHWRRGRVEFEKTRLEIAILKEREAERIESARKRRAAGLDARRAQDTESPDLIP